MQFRTFVLGWIAWLITTVVVAAGPVVDKATEAERMLEANDPAAAYAAIHGAFDEVWAKMPLTISNVALIDSVEGFGVYAPRDSDKYPSGVPVTSYAEVAGYAVGKNNTGGNEIGLDVDIVLKTAEGKKIWSGKGIMKSRQQIRAFAKEFFLRIDLNLANAPAGRYVATYTVSDVHSDKTASFDVGFELLPKS